MSFDNFCPNVIWENVVPSGGKLLAGNVRAPKHDIYVFLFFPNSVKEQ